jgi:hypothetical protein
VKAKKDEDLVSNQVVPGGGRGGIMVKNDISKAGVSTGYVLLDESPTIGYAMQWDADGDGRVEKHTEFDGYTTWPNWLKMTRKGDVYTGYYSTDQKTWTKIAEVTLPGIEAKQDVGVYSHNCAVKFADFTVTNQDKSR